jgi:CRISPR-associated protein Cmr1
MFGGGVSPGQTDETMLIRPSSVRGHLRFWWRATKGSECSSVEDLRKREAEIWGWAEKRSKVEISVAGTTEGTPISPKDLDLKYALFPFTADGRRNIAFNLALRCPDEYHGQVEKALRAWVNFGGIGARTRRGCGALYCKDLALPNADELRRVFSWNASSPGWPVLGEVKVSNERMPPEDAWRDLIELMIGFRQGKFGRTWTDGDPHRSKWPEANSLRRITGTYNPGHSPYEAGTTQADAFPRAELGLPIQFKFTKDGGDEENNCELLPDQGLTRMASPLILRPFVVAPGKAYAMIVRLQTPGVKAAKLTRLQAAGRPIVSTKLDRDVPAGEIRSAAAAAEPDSPLHCHVSAVDAFLAFAKSRL